MLVQKKLKYWLWYASMLEKEDCRLVNAGEMEKEEKNQVLICWSHEMHLLRFSVSQNSWPALCIATQEAVTLNGADECLKMAL